jgi:hypothetical protein
MLTPAKGGNMLNDREIIKIEHFGHPFVSNENAKLIRSDSRYHYIILFYR